MDEQIQRLEKRVAAQDVRIAQLERQIGRSSRNSSQPPSADRPGGAPKRGKACASGSRRAIKSRSCR
jgi:hypothetical protein